MPERNSKPYRKGLKVKLTALFANDEKIVNGRESLPKDGSGAR
jgi:hypothetical protein